MPNPSRKRVGKEAVPKPLQTGPRPRFVPTCQVTLPGAMEGVTALVRISNGVGESPTYGPGSSDNEEVAASVLGDVCPGLAKMGAFKGRSGWLAVTMIFDPSSLDGPFLSPMRELVQKALGSLDAEPVERCEPLSAGGRPFPVGVRAEWLFRPEAAIGDPTPSFLAELTIANFRCFYQNVTLKGPDKAAAGEEEPRLPIRPSDELVNHLLSLTDEAARVAAAGALAYVASQGELPLEAIERIGDALARLPTAAIIELCPVVGKALVVSGDVRAEAVRLRVARNIAGLLFSENEDVRIAAEKMFNEWRSVDSQIAARLAGRTVGPINPPTSNELERHPGESIQILVSDYVNTHPDRAWDVIKLVVSLAQQHADSDALKLYGLSEAAKRIGIDPTILKRAHKRGEIGTEIIPGLIVFHESECEKYVHVPGKAGRPKRKKETE